MIAIVDYGAGNIRSVVNVLKHFNVDYTLAQKEKTLYKADGVILPGVGAFGSAMKRLDDSGLSNGIKEVAKRGIPLFGICLGMQMLMDSSEESPKTSGLGIIEGTVEKLKAGGRKIPHIGWTSINRLGGKLLDNISESEYFYFVHSYGVHAKNRELVSASTTYGEMYDVMIEKDNIFGCQFHPEKSSLAGIKILENFFKICGEF